MSFTAADVTAASAHLAIRVDIRYPPPEARVGSDLDAILFAQPTLAGVAQTTYTLSLDGHPIDPASGRPESQVMASVIRVNTEVRVPLRHLSRGHHELVVAYRPDVDMPVFKTSVGFSVGGRPVRRRLLVVVLGAVALVAIALVARALRRLTPVARWIALGVVVVLAAGGVASAGFLSRSSGGLHPTVRGGGMAKPFRLPNLIPGEPEVDLAALRGRPVVVNFWASWCVPCRREMPAFQAVYQRVGGRIAFVGVDHQDSRRLALQFLAQTGVRYPSGYDPEGKTAASFGLFGLPATIFISPSGRILERHTGPYSEPDLQATLDRLFPA